MVIKKAPCKCCRQFRNVGVYKDGGFVFGPTDGGTDLTDAKNANLIWRVLSGDASCESSIGDVTLAGNTTIVRGPFTERGHAVVLGDLSETPFTNTVRFFCDENGGNAAAEITFSSFLNGQVLFTDYGTIGSYPAGLPNDEPFTSLSFSMNGPRHEASANVISHYLTLRTAGQTVEQVNLPFVRSDPNTISLADQTGFQTFPNGPNCWFFCRMIGQQLHLMFALGGGPEQYDSFLISHVFSPITFSSNGRDDSSNQTCVSVTANNAGGTAVCYMRRHDAMSCPYLLPLATGPSSAFPADPDSYLPWTDEPDEPTSDVWLPVDGNDSGGLSVLDSYPNLPGYFGLCNAWQRNGHVPHQVFGNNFSQLTITMDGVGSRGFFVPQVVGRMNSANLEGTYLLQASGNMQNFFSGGGPGRVESAAAFVATSRRVTGNDNSFIDSSLSNFFWRVSIELVFQEIIAEFDNAFDHFGVPDNYKTSALGFFRLDLEEVLLPSRTRQFNAGAFFSGQQVKFLGTMSMIDHARRKYGADGFDQLTAYCTGRVQLS